MVTILPHKTKAPRKWTNRRTVNAAAQMSAVCLVGALLAWIAGFDFDHRDPIVAGYSGLTLLCAVFFAWVCATE